ncbi:CSL zinc finger domain-containing protein 2 [Elsinoe australis]|uniref:CSL zinc finger domain-containing protein 2 n=1 Tax=Elsinoe australis TaxID=40998 RepID=A0A4U7B101_9PEZI|nr:CSL zinc finger domain-containing protein 2 [Elsinoe australis]
MADNIYDEIEIEDMTFEIGLGDLRDGEEIAVCPSCSLMIRVIFDEGDLPGDDGGAGQGAVTVEVGGA